MHVRDFDPSHFLKCVSGTRPFAEYCRHRGLTTPCERRRRLRVTTCWSLESLAELPVELRATVERELARVNEMAGREGIAHLMEATNVQPPVSIPAGAPLALWYFLHHRESFDEIFYHHEVREVRSWRVACATPRLSRDHLQSRTDAFESALRNFFQLGSRSGRFCVVEVRQLPGASCFVAHIADRSRLVEWFTRRGRLVSGRVRPVRTLHFAYHPADGMVLLDAPLRSIDRLGELLHCFARVVLGVPVRECATAFDLDRLKQPFHPAPDGTDMGVVRVKNLHFRYPAHRGPRIVKFETLSNDQPNAIEEMLHDHLRGSITMDELNVSHAELQVQLRIDGREKPYLVRLWPDRCNLSQSPIGVRLWACLRRWGLCHAR